MKRWILWLVLPALLAVSPSCSRDPKVRSRGLVEVGNKYLSKDRLREASLMFRKAISVDRMNPEAYYRLGLTEEKMGIPGAAVREFRRTLDLQANHMEARKHLADLYLRNYQAFWQNPFASAEQHKQARKPLEEQVEIFRKADPKSFETLRLEGHLLLADGKQREATAKLQAANQIKPLEPDVVLALVQALTLDDRFPDGEKVASSLIQKEKAYTPIYLFLYSQYVFRNRLEDAESILKTHVANNPKSARPVLQLALHYFAQKKRSEMAQALKRLLSNPKDFPEARLSIGDFYFRTGEWDQASRYYQEGARANPKLKSVYQKRLVELLVQQERTSDAVRLVEEILRSNPKDLEAQAFHVTLLLSAGGTRELLAATSELESLIAKSRENPNPVLHYELGLAYWKRGDHTRAEAQLQEAANLKPDYLPPRILLAQLDLWRFDFTHASQTADEILRLDPRNLAGRVIRARALARLGKINEARADLLVAQKINPNSGDVIFHTGLLQTMEHKFKEAEATFRSLYEKSDYRGLSGLMEVYAAQNQYDRAIQWLQAELAKAPASADLRNHLANMAAASGKYDLAIATFKVLIEQDPAREGLHLRLGDTYRRAGDIANATQCFRKAKSLAPGDTAASLQLALALEMLGRKVEAESIYEDILRLEPDNPTALSNLAYALAERGGDLDRALTLSQRAKQRDPQNPHFSDTLAWIYLKKHLNDSAVGVFREIVTQMPDNCTFRYHYGMALLQKGDKVNAKKELETALRNKPSKEDESKIKELLGRIG